MTNRQIPPQRDLHLIPDLPPHPHPLDRVLWGDSTAGFVDPSISVDPAYHNLLEDALRFAQHLVLHPHALPEAAKVLGETNAPDVLVVKAIRRVLATRRWTICLEKGSGGPSWHSSPVRLTAVASDTERTIFFGGEYAMRLLQAFTSGTELDQGRQLVIAAISLAGTLIHGIRLQVKVELLHYPEYKIVLDHGQGNGECSSMFEISGLGGVVECGWEYDRPKPEELEPVPYTPDAIPAFDFKALQAEYERECREAKALYRRLNETSIDFLSLRPREPTSRWTAVSTRHRISDEWVMEAWRLHQAGSLNGLELPIPYDAQELKHDKHEILGRHHRVTCRMGYRTPRTTDPRYTSLDSILPLAGTTSCPGE